MFELQHLMLLHDMTKLVEGHIHIWVEFLLEMECFNIIFARKAVRSDVKRTEIDMEMISLFH